MLRCHIANAGHESSEYFGCRYVENIYACLFVWTPTCLASSNDRSVKYQHHGGHRGNRGQAYVYSPHQRPYYFCVGSVLLCSATPKCVVRALPKRAQPHPFSHIAFIPNANYQLPRTPSECQCSCTVE